MLYRVCSLGLLISAAFGEQQPEQTIAKDRSLCQRAQNRTRLLPQGRIQFYSEHSAPKSL